MSTPEDYIKPKKVPEKVSSAGESTTEDPFFTKKDKMMIAYCGYSILRLLEKLAREISREPSTEVEVNHLNSQQLMLRILHSRFLAVIEEGKKLKSNK